MYWYKHTRISEDDSCAYRPIKEGGGLWKLNEGLGRSRAVDRRFVRGEGEQKNRVYKRMRCFGHVSANQNRRNTKCILKLPLSLTLQHRMQLLSRWSRFTTYKYVATSAEQKKAEVDTRDPRKGRFLPVLTSLNQCEC